jgi:hypothetical protein
MWMLRKGRCSLCLHDHFILHTSTDDGGCPALVTPPLPLPMLLPLAPPYASAKLAKAA